MAPLLLEQDFRRFALFTNDTAFAQDLRTWYQNLLPSGGGEIVADEVVPSGQGDYTAQAGRIAAANPDLVIVLPQTIPDIDYLLTPLRDAGYSGPGATSLGRRSGCHRPVRRPPRGFLPAGFDFQE